MKNILGVLLLVCCSLCAGAQKVLTVDMDAIRQKTRDPSSAYYYPKLLERYKKGDTTLTDDQFKCLYYGASLSKDYDPYGTEDNEAFMKLYRDKKYREAIPSGLAALEKDPLNFTLNFKMLVCYNELGINDSAELFARRYFPLLYVIYRSGTGTSVEKAMVVTAVNHEYEILRHARLSSTGQALIGRTDKLTINREGQQKEPIVEALYFNVEIPMARMHDILMESPPAVPDR